MVDATVITAFILKELDWSRYVDIVNNRYTVEHAVKEVSNAAWKYPVRGFISEEKLFTI